ncbi:MAG: glycine--tRNA ligase subunit beta [Porticoccaceae bacterium]|nr:glycine--tRNA ligase subunit beta [Porticoccaceae bacterium]
MSADFLVELGTEELPPKALKTLMDAFVTGVADGLQKAELSYSDIKGFASPRRLALVVTDLADTQNDILIEKLGPLVSAAFDADGQPTKAAQGFARGCGLGATSDDLATLEHIDTDKGPKLCYRDTKAGATTAELAPGIVSAALKSLPVPKRMRWGSRRQEFVRPAHWLVMLFGEQVLPGDILGLQAGRLSRGHRVHCDQDISIESPANYCAQLREAYVLADFDERREHIRQHVNALAVEAGGVAVMDDALLDEVTALNEWPNPLLGRFDKVFLEVPQEALVSSMQEHQKYFPVVDEAGTMLPLFITVANIASKAPEQVIAGNERVIRPRFADAKFFYETDLKTNLSAQRERLKNIVYQAKLGSVFDKTERVAKLASAIAPHVDAPANLAQRAAKLSKSDLVSEMVLEFSDLQGTMGRYYAHHDGEDAQVADALFEQYLPRFAGDELPTNPVGIALALADRLDTLSGIFGIGQSPSGSRDPFGLRRASLAVLRILIERKIDLDLGEFIALAAAGHGELPEQDGLVAQVQDYVLGRLRALCEESHIPAEMFLSVAAKQLSKPLDIHRRILAVNAFAKLPEAASLAAANKRVSNILQKQDASSLTGDVDTALFENDAEHALWATLSEMGTHAQPLIDKGDYEAALSLLAGLREPVDAYFDSVMVMADDEAIRLNRCRVLAKLRHLFLEVADVSLLASKVGAN